MFYVYVDWTCESIPRPFYVGKGTLARIRCLLRNKRHANIAKCYGIERRITLSTPEESEAFLQEKTLIQTHKTYAHGGEGWWGANYTLGGEGTSGAKHVWSSERKIAASLSQLQSFQNHKRLKIHKEATRKQWLDETRRGAQSERMKQNNPAITHPDTDVTKQKKSKGQKKRFECKEERKRLSEMTKLSCQNPDVYKRRSDAQKLRRQIEREKKALT